MLSNLRSKVLTAVGAVAIVAIACLPAMAVDTTGVSTAMAAIQVDITGVMTAVAPVAITIFGVFLCWKFGKKIFRVVAG
jgi:hypothetical protein